MRPVVSNPLTILTCALLTVGCANQKPGRLSVIIRGESRARERAIQTIRDIATVHGLGELETTVRDTLVEIRSNVATLRALAGLVDALYTASFHNALSLHDLQRFLRVLDSCLETPTDTVSNAQLMANRLFAENAEPRSATRCFLTGGEDDFRLYLLAGEIPLIDSLLHDSVVGHMLEEQGIPLPRMHTGDTVQVRGKPVVEPLFAVGEPQFAADIVDSLTLDTQTFVLQRFIAPSFDQIFPEYRDIGHDSLARHILNTEGEKKLRELADRERRMTDSLGADVVCRHRPEYPVLVVHASKTPDSIARVLYLKDRSIDLRRLGAAGIVRLAREGDDTLRTLNQCYDDRGIEPTAGWVTAADVRLEWVGRDTAIVFHMGFSPVEDERTRDKEESVRRLAQRIALGTLPDGVRVECGAIVVE